jgi:UDP-GlcNAc:undecaprenyl-phosphate/decaprenyl-phosphate GlcNAc-1-phosphate transferase
MLTYSLVSFLVALISVFLIRRYFRKHALDYSADAPQRFHHGATPRLGGMGIFLGWMLGLFVAILLDSRFAGNTAVLASTVAITFVVFLVVVVGTAEDYTQKVTPKWRLLLTGIAAIAAIYWLGLSVPRLDLAILDQYWARWPVLGILLAFIGLVGLTHAFNLIDGYNGLAGTVAVLIALAYAYVSFKVGDRELLIMSVCVVAATLGFLFLNYPRGLIFAGDGGAYFWGFLLALIGILLVQRHPQVSAWFPVLLLIYPIWETAFSTYRKLARGQSPGMADALHLHQLVYHRVVRSVFHEDEAKMLLSRNNRTTPYLIVFTTFAIVPATLFWDKTAVLILATILFAVSYCLAYILIIRFKVPRWLQR